MILRSALLAPIVVPQALWVAARAARLPEAAGERSGMIGKGPDVSLLVLGDSSAAGVGVAHQDQALAGQLSARLAKQFKVHWQLVARSGETTAGTLKELRRLAPRPVNFVVIALGVNDTKNGVPFSAWEERYTEIVDLLTEEFGAPHICMSGLPPVREFPLLPSPLNQVLGARAERFDGVLRDLSSSRPNTTHLPMAFDLDVSKMASDGFHPGPEVYAEWARLVAELFIEGRPST